MVAFLVFRKEHRRIAVVLDALVVHVATDVQFRPHDGLDALLVAGPHKLKRRHHVAVVRHSQGGHAHVLGGRDQFANRAYGLQNTELRVHVEVRERDVFQGCRSRCIHLVCPRGLFGHLFFGRVKVGGFQSGRFVLDLFRVLKLRTLNDSKSDHFEKAPRRGSHIVGRVVRVPKTFPKELLVEFSQGGPLELTAASSWDGTELRTLIFGVDDGNVREGLGGLVQAEQFRPDHVDVEADVVAHHVVRVGRIGHELGRHIGQGNAFRLRPVRGDPVDFGRVVRDGKSVGLHDSVAAGQQLAIGVVELPRQLHQTRPVVAVRDGCVPVPGQAGRFRVVDENHGVFEIRECPGVRTSLVDACFPQCIPMCRIFALGLPF